MKSNQIWIIINNSRRCLAEIFAPEQQKVSESLNIIGKILLFVESISIEMIRLWFLQKRHSRDSQENCLEIILRFLVWARGKFEDDVMRWKIFFNIFIKISKICLEPVAWFSPHLQEKFKSFSSDWILNFPPLRWNKNALALFRISSFNATLTQLNSILKQKFFFSTPLWRMHK